MEDPFTPNPDPGFDFGTGAGLVAADKAVRSALFLRRVTRLKVNSECSNSDSLKLWKVTNPNSFDIDVEWKLADVDQAGTTIAKANSETYLTTISKPGDLNLLQIAYKASFGVQTISMAKSSRRDCVNDSLSVTQADNKDLLNNNIALHLFPNPAKEKLTIAFLGEEDTKFRIEIYDKTGRLRYSENHAMLTANHLKEVNLSSLSTGMYILRAISNKTTLTKSFIKDR